FRGKDWWPWRFRRRLSLLARPIISLGNGNVVYSPAFCEDSFRHLVTGCFYGRFETEYFDSPRMRGFVGRVNSDRGHQFNHDVAEVFSSCGFQVRTEVQMSEFCAPEQEASGDVDVLAWRGDTAFICECKSLLFARTVSEIAEQLNRFQGRNNDDLTKHIRRYTWIQSNRDSLRKITGRVSFATIRSLLVSSTLVPMHFKSALSVDVKSIKELPNFLTQ